MKEETTKRIAVLGMHRSGTSMLSGVLTKLGLYPGDKEQLYGPNVHNLKGYFENKTIVRCNEEILSRAAAKRLPGLFDKNCFSNNKTLDNLGWIFGAWALSDLNTKCSSFELELIINSINGYKKNAIKNQPWVIKDPRLSLTLKKWSEVIEINAAIIMIRNPADVAYSLYKRDNISSDMAFNLWLAYMHGAFTSVQGIPYIVIDYDEFIRNHHSGIQRIINFLSDYNIYPDKTQKKNAESSIDSALNHSNKNNLAKIPDNLMNLYQKFMAKGWSKTDNTLTHSMNDIKDGWKEAIYIAFEKKIIDITNDITSNYERKILLYKNKIDRINNHIVSGSVLTLIRKIKKDPTFGTYEKIDC